MKFRTGKREDNQLLIDFCKNQYMPGTTQITLERSPNFMDAMDVEGIRPHVFLCEVKDNIAAIGTGSEKYCQVNGKKEWVGYLGNLRVDQKFQKGTLLARAYRYLREMQEEMNCKISLTTILEENQQAQKVLTSKKGGLPPYEDYGKLTSYVFGANKNLFKNRCPKYTFRVANRGDLEALVAFLAQSDRQFYPCYTAEDIMNDDGILKGLSIHDFHLCLKEDEIIGCIATWDQTAFRRWKIQSYNRWIRFTRPFLNFFARRFGLPYYPPQGKAIPYNTLSCMKIKDDNPEVCESILHEIWKKSSANDIFVTVLHEKDRLNKVFQKPMSLKVYSRLYIVHWDEEGEEAFNDLDGRVPYIEPGSI